MSRWPARPSRVSVSHYYENDTEPSGLIGKIFVGKKELTSSFPFLYNRFHYVRRVEGPADRVVSASNAWNAPSGHGSPG